MDAITFDTLSSAKRLRDQGFSEKQAEAVISEITAAREIDSRKLATRSDLRELELRMTIRLGGWIAAIMTFFKVMEKFF